MKIRKQNGIMLFATQSPRDAILSPIAHTIIEQCATQIFLPNAKGSKSDYCDGFKLTAREFELVGRELAASSRRFLIKQGQTSVVAELNLSGFDDELAILSGRTGNVELLEGILAEMQREAVGNGWNHAGEPPAPQPEVWMKRFHATRFLAQQRKAG